MLGVATPELRRDRGKLVKVSVMWEGPSHDRLTCAVKRWVNRETETAIGPTVADIRHRADNILRAYRLKKRIDSLVPAEL